MKTEELEGEVLKQQGKVKDRSSGLNGTFREFRNKWWNCWNNMHSLLSKTKTYSSATC